MATAMVVPISLPSETYISTVNFVMENAVPIKMVVKKNRNGPVGTTGELARIVLRAIPKKFHVRNIHPATRVFQAVRIFVNDELACIEKSLGQAYRLLASGGRIMAISFHSLEDRIVKEKFRRLSRGCECAEGERDCRCAGEGLVKILTDDPANRRLFVRLALDDDGHRPILSVFRPGQRPEKQQGPERAIAGL